MIFKTSGTILCVEPNPDTSKLITLMLGLEGYEVVVTHSMTGAVLLINNQKFDLYILESRLLDGCGIDLCKFIKSKYESASVVFYSASAFPINIAAAYSAGANDYLTKPTGWDRLLETINRLLRVREHNLEKEYEIVI